MFDDFRDVVQIRDRKLACRIIRIEGTKYVY